ncbi:MAG TPA: monovalent cation/H(+) antiporter subunit G [Denitromonas sp.]|uniref:monovalent cation/H(+) antiporter subunit G n=1 Tax=Denitromonas sp. TaxID=2734609 RepID=UPI001DAF0885|nr:monovalent cation/H(+) antiporter subunit G [Rhodocyclaceae bacterium]HPR07396.1 monovalent cation/H(+) antiporter subunit G [Denitromonas sp.]HQU88080.1 monovalent cation/H(+) antiporter subunit G [Denitromonas sp.]HQV14758.1 monovalent cation/H(+) antiporter subunit G [Denitromonas sp.]
MSTVIDILSMILMSVGGVFCLIGAIGVLRMPGFYTRMHAASVIDTLGATLIIIGLLLQSGFTLASGKLLILWLLIFFCSPTASHSLANAAHRRGVIPWQPDQGAKSSSKN